VKSGNEETNAASGTNAPRAASKAPAAQGTSAAKAASGTNAAAADGNGMIMDGRIVELAPDERDRGIVRASVVGIVANVLLTAVKAAVGLLSNSIAIVLDAVNSLSDAAASGITIVGTKLAGKQPDRKHPFGYGRIEYLTTIIIAVIVLWAGIESLQQSVGRIITPEPADYDTVTLIVVAIAVVAKIMLGLYTKRVGARLNSGALVASGADSMMDSIISAATLAAALIYLLCGLSLEAWLGAIIALIIIKAGVDMLREVLSKIIGERISPDTARSVKETVASVDGVLGAYDLMLDDYGPDKLWGSVHVEVPDTMSADQIDELTRRIQRKVYQRCDVILHTVGVYSQNTKGGVTAEIRAAVIAYADADPYILEVHGFYAEEDQHAARLDLVVSFDADDRHAVVAAAKEYLEKRYPGWSFEIALDSDISD
jgi:cation diffusion facilitator family transporter